MKSTQDEFRGLVCEVYVSAGAGVCVCASGYMLKAALYSAEWKQDRTWLHGSPVLEELLHNPCSV